MAFLLHRPLFSCATAALGLSGAAYGLLSHQHRNPLRLDSGSNPITSSSTSPKDWSFSQYQNNAQAPVVNSRGGLNAKSVRQMTLGSILGTLRSSSHKKHSQPYDHLGLTLQHRPRLRPSNFPLQQASRPSPRSGLPRPSHGGKAARNLDNPVQHAAKIRQRCGSAQRGARQRRAESQLRRHVCAQRVRELLTVTLAASSREGLEADGVEDVEKSEGSEEGW
jgi:hypothetical protein